MSNFFHSIYNRIRPAKTFIKDSKSRRAESIDSSKHFDIKLKTELENLFDLKIVNNDLFEQALTHRSYLQVTNESEKESNERLEFLGDAVLNLIVADYLFKENTDFMEGDLTKMRSWLVNKSALAVYAKKIGLEKYLLLSYSATKSLEKGSESILADALEAIIGAIYLDSGFESARKFIVQSIVPVVEKKSQMIDKNYKSMYLEIIQSKGLSSPTYRVLEETGPDHEKNFVVGIYVNDELKGTGTGRSKKQAEQLAARNALKTETFFIDDFNEDYLE